jgi:hypothetical protein
VLNRREEQLKVCRYRNFPSARYQQNCLKIFRNSVGFCVPPLEQQPLQYHLPDLCLPPQLHGEQINSRSHLDSQFAGDCTVLSRALRHGKQVCGSKPVVSLIYLLLMGYPNFRSH